MQIQLEKQYDTKKIIKKGITISLIIGSMLNIINQGDNIFGGNWDKINMFKIFLTYLTPFLVSVYSTVTALRDKH